jgi:predicted DNA-binding transcriptional regulator YafY
VPIEDHPYLVSILGDLFPERRRFKERRNRTDRTLHPGEGEVVIDTPEGRRAVTVAAMILAQVAERGGSVLDRDSLLGIARQGLATFPEEERPAVLEEVVAVLDWLAEHLVRREKAVDKKAWGDVTFDSEPLIQAIKQAIEAGTDLEIEYFAYHRGEWSSRRITPRRMRGEFVEAWCHLRDDERRFRVSRIRKMNEVEAT